MTQDRLPTELYVAAHLRRLSARGVPAYVLRRGAPDSGMVLLKIVVRGRGCRLLSQSRDPEGVLGWLDPHSGEIIDESRADQYIQRAVARDPDLWAIEIEDRDGQNPFEGKIF